MQGRLASSEIDPQPGYYPGLKHLGFGEEREAEQCFRDSARRGCKKSIEHVLKYYRQEFKDNYEMLKACCSAGYDAGSEQEYNKFFLWCAYAAYLGRDLDKTTEILRHLWARSRSIQIGVFIAEVEYERVEQQGRHDPGAWAPVTQAISDFVTTLDDKYGNPDFLYLRAKVWEKDGARPQEREKAKRWYWLSKGDRKNRPRIPGLPEPPQNLDLNALFCRFLNE